MLGSTRNVRHQIRRAHATAPPSIPLTAAGMRRHQRQQRESKKGICYLADYCWCSASSSSSAVTYTVATQFRGTNTARRRPAATTSSSMSATVCLAPTATFLDKRNWYARRLW